MLKKFIAALFLFLCFFPILKAQDKSVGVALKGGTTGAGGDVVFRFHEKMTARVGYDMLAYTYPFNLEQDDINFEGEASVKLGAFSALYDFSVTNWFFLSAGIGLNNFNVQANGDAPNGMPLGDITLTAEKVGSFDATITPSMKLSPYLGLGFGKPLSTDKLVAFAFEIGTYYQGGPAVDLVTTGLIEPTSNPDNGVAALLEKQFSQYSMWPVIRFNLSFNIAKF